VPTLNPHTFPLVPYPGPAPEGAPRGGPGGWEPYGLPAPSDSFLPFVLSRARLGSNGPWLACAWVEHADTGGRIRTLTPTGPGGITGPLTLLVRKLVDLPNEAEHFLYTGALVAGLGLPCGVPLRLVLDNAWQSPRFFAIAPAAQLPAAYLPLEWFHDGPLNGVPYGSGLRQRLYVDNAALSFLDPRPDKVSSKDADTGREVLISLSLFARTSFALEPVPAYLAQALSAAPAVRYFLADAEPWQLTEVKTTLNGPDGGRWSISATLESLEPLLSRGCRLEPLPEADYDPALPARGWRCADASDTAADYLPSGTQTCETDASGDNTGFSLAVTKDYNPYSPTFGQTRTQRLSDPVACPLPVRYQSNFYVTNAYRDNCPPGYRGATIGPTVESPLGAYQSRVSQADADAQAHADAQRRAQAAANAQVLCVADTTGYHATYEPNGCFSGYMVSDTDPTNRRDATQAEYARYFTAESGSDGLFCPRYN